MKPAPGRLEVADKEDHSCEQRSKDARNEARLRRKCEVRIAKLGCEERS